jgi:addiction module HigA family antidote
MNTKEFAAGRPHRMPTHPGAVLRETVLPSLRMSVAAAAGHLGVTRQTLHRILAERTAVTPEMALRLGKFCGNGPGLWLRMQQAYDLWHAEEKLHDEVERIPTVREAA